MRLWAVRELTQRRHRSAAAALTAALRAKEPQMRKEAAQLLDKLGDASTAPALRDRVADGVWYVRGYSDGPDDPEAGGKGGALAALRKVAAEDATPALLKASASKTLRVRAWALQELLKEKGASEDPAVVAAFAAALKEKDGDETLWMVYRGR